MSTNLNLSTFQGRVPMTETHPDRAKLYHSVRNSAPAESFTYSSNKKVWWRCPSGHEWEAVVASVVRLGTGCPYCANQKIATETSLQTSHPQIVQQDWSLNNLISPSTVHAGSTHKVLWACSAGHEYLASVRDHVGHSGRPPRGCPYCSNVSVLAGFNDLATLYPDVASRLNAEMSGVSSSEISPFSHKKVWWNCADYPHQYLAQPANIVAGKQGCGVCSGKQVLPGFNDLATLHPTLAPEMKSHDPSTVSEASGRLVEWECINGHKWTTTPAHRTIDGNNCPQCKMHGTSKQEKDLFDFVHHLVPEAQQGKRSLVSSNNRLQADIFIPLQNIAIEYNGLYWHSDAVKPRHYHKQKEEAFRQAGIQLIQVWEDDWRDRRPVVEKMLMHKLGMSSDTRCNARDLEVAEISYAESNEFLNANHIQGGSRGSLYLSLGGKAVLVATRTGQPGEYRIDRYATSAIVRGGFSKLLKHAEAALGDVSRWVTFADREVSDGNLYKTSGFVAEDTLPPDYKYLYKGKRVHKFNFRRGRAISRTDLVWSENKTEAEFARENHLARIWDSGKVKYVYTTNRGH